MDKRWLTITCKVALPRNLSTLAAAPLPGNAMSCFNG